MSLLVAARLVQRRPPTMRSLYFTRGGCAEDNWKKAPLNEMKTNALDCGGIVWHAHSVKGYLSLADFLGMFCSHSVGRSRWLSRELCWVIAQTCFSSCALPCTNLQIEKPICAKFGWVAQAQKKRNFFSPKSCSSIKTFDHDCPDHSCPPSSLVSPQEGGGRAGAGVGVGMLRGRGIPFIENKKVSKF